MMHFLEKILLKFPNAFLSCRRYKFLLWNWLKKYDSLLRFIHSNRKILKRLMTLSGLVIKPSTRTEGPDSKTRFFDLRLWQKNNSVFITLINRFESQFKQDHCRSVVIFAPHKEVGLESGSFESYSPIRDVQSIDYVMKRHSVYCSSLKEVTTDGAGLIFDSQNIYLHESFINLSGQENYGRTSHIFYTAEKSRVVGSFPRMASVRQEENNLALIFGPYYNNYWHFLIEYLPKVCNLVPGTTIVAPSNLKYRDILEKVCNFRNLEILYLKFGLYIKCNESFVVSSPILYISAQEISVDYDLLLKYQSMMVSLFLKTHSPISKKIFLLRKSIRRINLDKLLLKELKLDRFQLVDIARLPLEKQANYFQNSKVVLAYPGANWANFLFASKSSDYFNLVEEKNNLQAVHHVVANIFGAQLTNLNIEHDDSKQKTENIYAASDKVELSFSPRQVKWVINRVR